jgi:hypothetical protein
VVLKLPALTEKRIGKGIYKSERTGAMSSNIIIKKVCQQCGKVFEAKISVTKFCSLKCNNKNLKLRKRGAYIFPQQKLTRKTVNHCLADLTSMEFLSVVNISGISIKSSRTYFEEEGY